MISVLFIFPKEILCTKFMVALFILPPNWKFLQLLINNIINNKLKYIHVI